MYVDVSQCYNAFRKANCSVCISASVCLSLCELFMVWCMNTRWEQRPHSQKQNKLQGKEVVNINKDPIRRFHVKRRPW